MPHPLDPAALPEDRLLAAWCGAVEALRDRGSAERRAVEEALVASSGLSAAGLEAGLEAVLGGVREPAARRVLAAARAGRELAPREPVLVVLAGNLPGLVVQPLLPILALGRTAIVKPASSEPVFPPAFVAALATREPALGRAIEVAPWPGGNAEIEAAVLARVGTVLAYGGAESTSSLARRAPGRTVIYGPKTSVAVVSADAGDLAAVAEGLARDVALFDQRGCLSIEAVFVEAARASSLAAELARALERQAVRWPPGRTEPAVAAAVHRLRATADLAGWYRPESDSGAGTVIVPPAGSPFELGPGGRTVRVHPVDRLEAVLELLAPWRRKLQGAALAGDRAWRLGPALEELGISRLAAPGDLQSPDASWHNGGVNPLEVLTSSRAPRRSPP